MRASTSTSRCADSGAVGIGLSASPRPTVAGKAVSGSLRAATGIGGPPTARASTNTCALAGQSPCFTASGSCTCSCSNAGAAVVEGSTDCPAASRAIAICACRACAAPGSNCGSTLLQISAASALRPRWRRAMPSSQLARSACGATRRACCNHAMAVSSNCLPASACARACAASTSTPTSSGANAAARAKASAAACASPSSVCERPSSAQPSARCGSRCRACCSAVTPSRRVATDGAGCTCAARGSPTCRYRQAPATPSANTPST